MRTNQLHEIDVKKIDVEEGKGETKGKGENEREKEKRKGKDNEGKEQGNTQKYAPPTHKPIHNLHTTTHIPKERCKENGPKNKEKKRRNEEKTKKNKREDEKK
ncbi:hypothetical protein RhiirA1_401399 [Rhizophagus irregularis]|uniref:Uncharacterized protein n=1 Tax=Rhizophagus irregularis TaxID=588596 RepID=A0A2N0R2B3_9GLOM|nr:hypothetical protein RhiirA1_401399 [Rhizophagus irregularis]